MKPREYDWLRHEPPEVQVVGQVTLVERAIQAGASRPGVSVVVVNHARLTQEPAAVVADVAQALRDAGHEPAARREPPPPFVPSHKNTEKSLRERVEKALDRFQLEASKREAA